MSRIIYKRFSTGADLCAPYTGASQAEIAAARIILAHANFEATRHPCPETEQRAAAARQHLDHLLGGTP
jgi:N-formylglutamate amidohydrolase